MPSTYYIFSPGRLSRRENTLLLEKDDSKKFIPVEDVDEIYIMTEVDMNSRLINFLGQNGIVVHFFNYYGWYTGSLIPREGNISGKLLVKQVEHYLNPSSRIFIAREFIKGSIANSLKNIRVDFDEKILNSARDIDTLMSMEAAFRKEYYRALGEKTGWDFEKRTRHPPQNPLNALISFGNSLVYTAVLKEIFHTQLNPAVSYLHEPSTRRYSLSLDVAEIFKPLIADRIILKLTRKGILSENHFLKELNSTYLNDEGRRLFLQEFDRLMKSTYSHPTLKRKVSMRQLIRLELYKLIKHLLGEKKYTSLKAWW